MLFTYIAQLNKKILVLTQYHSYKPWPSFILRFLIYACKSLGTVYRHQTVLGDTQRQFLNSFVKFLLLNSLEKLKRFILITPPPIRYVLYYCFIFLEQSLNANVRELWFYVPESQWQNTIPLPWRFLLIILWDRRRQGMFRSIRVLMGIIGYR